MAKIRIFIAFELPEAQKASLRNLQSELKKQGGNVRWVRPEGIHLTLKFLGDVDENQIDEIDTATKNAANDIAAMKIQIKGTGAFPNFRRPRVFWVGVNEPSGNLSALADEIEEQLAQVGFQKEQRAFKPHLTLGRVKDSRGLDTVIKHIQTEEFDGGSFTAHKLVLMQSQLKPTGAEYTPLRTIELATH